MTTTPPSGPAPSHPAPSDPAPPSRNHAACLRALAGGATSCLVLAILSACASTAAPRATAERESGSMPIDAVRERQARQRQQREELALARANHTETPADPTTPTDPTTPADPTTGADPLADWLARAESDGLLAVSDTNTPDQPRRGRARPAPLPQHAIDPGPGFSPVEPAPAETPEPAPAPPTPAAAEALPLIAASPDPAAHATTPDAQTTNAANRPLDLNTNTDTARDASSPALDPINNSKPLAALVKLHAARTAGDTSITDEQFTALERSLTPRETEFYTAWKSLQSSIAASANAGADTEELKRAARHFAQAAQQWDPLRIPKAVLCTRVEGFGLYQELRRAPAAGNPADAPAYTFLAGRRNKFIVYCEVDGFTSRPTAAAGATLSPGPGYEVKLAQDLTLYTASTARDVVAWRKHDQPIKDLSKNQRRDFFIVQVVELPETLSVGAYVLKVRVRDLHAAAATTGSLPGGEAQAEAVIPIDIVADDSAMR